MRTLSLPYSPVILAALIGVACFTPEFVNEPEVVDPTTGETVAISQIDIDALSDEDRADIGDQLAEQGISPRGRGRADLSEVEVVDPATGETSASENDDNGRGDHRGSERLTPNLLRSG